uniref:Uncharacterized protein n=1 Tax=Mycena chlorophos TaxID=658473 RepID=A0ABQ0LXL5_MYCCL|nr:predicted protein [Mycena chlorophos]
MPRKPPPRPYDDVQHRNCPHDVPHQIAQPSTVFVEIKVCSPPLYDPFDGVRADGEEDQKRGVDQESEHREDGQHHCHQNDIDDEALCILPVDEDGECSVEGSRRGCNVAGHGLGHW